MTLNKYNHFLVIKRCGTPLQYQVLHIHICHDSISKAFLLVFSSKKSEVWLNAAPV